MDSIRFGAPCHMCGGASGHPEDGSGCARPRIPCPHGAYSQTLCMTCNREHGRIGGSGVAATHVEGREAPMPCTCGHDKVFHGRHGCTGGAASDPCRCSGFAVIMDGPDESPMEACEMPASSGGAEWVATVERCARAAEVEFHCSHESTADMWREVARAVLAAAARGAK